METIQLECTYMQNGKLADNQKWTADLMIRSKKDMEDNRTFRIAGTSVDKIDRPNVVKRYIHPFCDLNDGELEFLVFSQGYQPIHYKFSYDSEMNCFLGWWEWINPGNLQGEFGGYALARATKTKLKRAEQSELGNATEALRKAYGIIYAIGYSTSGLIMFNDDFGRTHRSSVEPPIEEIKKYFKENMKPFVKEPNE